MKDRTREAVFNLLGPSVRGTRVWDLFAGTGAMGIEAISRGAIAATLIECHIGAASVIRRNVEALDLGDRVHVERANVFTWTHDALADRAAAGADHEEPRWLVFCCPPYAFYNERLSDLRDLLLSLRQAAPADSTFVVEAERPFDFESVWPGDWTVRDYAPASIGLARISRA